MTNFYFHIEQGGSAHKRVYHLRENTRQEAVDRLIATIGGHDFATGLVRSWEEAGKSRANPRTIYLG